jgi:hypothetical protein
VALALGAACSGPTRSTQTDDRGPGSGVAVSAQPVDAGAGSTAPVVASTTSKDANMVVKLLVSSSAISMKDRKSFSVGIEVENTSNGPVAPNLDTATLTANGAHAYAWDLAIQNGARDARWDALPPGEKLTMSWPLGEALFEKPGDYKLELKLGAHEATASVKVSK